MINIMYDQHRIQVCIYDESLNNNNTQCNHESSHPNLLFRCLSAGMRVFFIHLLKLDIHTRKNIIKTVGRIESDDDLQVLFL
jgi:hypothetical protein